MKCDINVQIDKALRPSTSLFYTLTYSGDEQSCTLLPHVTVSGDVVRTSRSPLAPLVARRHARAVARVGSRVGATHGARARPRRAREIEHAPQPAEVA